MGGGSETLVVHGTQDPIVSSTTAHCLGRNSGQENVLFETRYDEVVRIHHSELSPTLTSSMGTGGGNVPIISCRKQIIRKLTPSECEKLQGFPINYTKIPYRNKPTEDCPDSPRYKAIGNSMAVPVIKWIGERIINYMEN